MVLDEVRWGDGGGEDGGDEEGRYGEFSRFATDVLEGHCRGRLGRGSLFLLGSEESEVVV